jgi:cell division septal protein FtsQ
MLIRPGAPPRRGSVAVARAGRGPVTLALRPRRLLLRLVVPLALAVLALGGGWLLLRDASFLRVREVTVTGATGPDARAIRAALTDAARGMTTLHVRRDALRAAVAPYPIVRDVEASRAGLRGLDVRVLEHEAVAELRAGSARIAVAADGTVLGQDVRLGALPQLDVPVAPTGRTVTVPAVRQAVSMLALAPAPLRRRIERAAWGRLGLRAELADGPQLLFGPPTRLRAKWAAAIAVLADAGSQGAHYVDLRLPERPVAGWGELAPPGPAAG